jgi:hypothetical protein
MGNIGTIINLISIQMIPDQLEGIDVIVAAASIKVS